MPCVIMTGQRSRAETNANEVGSLVLYWAGGISSWAEVGTNGILTSLAVVLHDSKLGAFMAMSSLWWGACGGGNKDLQG
jgi:hypothetical protein